VLLAIEFNTGAAPGGVASHELEDGGTSVGAGVGVEGAGVGVGSPTGPGVGVGVTGPETADHDAV
jgi:hypothetical protein